MKKTDLILVVIALMAAAGIWLFYSAGAEKGGVAVVTVDGEVMAELALQDADRVRIPSEKGYNVIEVKDGQAFVAEADCRDQICVDHKHIEKTGETIVCLPHKLVVEIKDAGEEAPGDVVLP